jgi:hypothetical protein
MNRRTRNRLAVVGLAIVTIAATSIAWSAITLRLPGHGTGTALNIAWDVVGSTPTTNDASGQLDPTGPGMSPTRDTADIGMATAAFNSGSLVLTASSVYSGYRFSWLAEAKPTGSTALKVQSVTLVDDPTVAGSIRFTPGTDGPQGYVSPSTTDGCGKSLASPMGSAGVSGEVKFPAGIPTDGRVFAFTLQVNLVPAASFVAGSCNSWS